MASAREGVLRLLVASALGLAGAGAAQEPATPPPNDGASAPPSATADSNRSSAERCEESEEHQQLSDLTILNFFTEG